MDHPERLHKLFKDSFFEVILKLNKQLKIFLRA